MLRLNKEVKKKTSRIYLTIKRGYRDENGKSRNKHIESIGYLDILEKQYDDPIAHFENLVKKRNEEEAKTKTIMIEVNTEARIEEDSPGMKNYDHIILSKIYH